MAWTILPGRAQYATKYPSPIAIAGIEDTIIGAPIYRIQCSVFSPGLLKLQIWLNDEILLQNDTRPVASVNGSTE